MKTTITATNPASISIVLGVALVIMGNPLGWLLAFGGIALNALWIFA
ncbi:MAG: hypothetical protein HZB68_02275 [Candidatus Aenigmarchaeota archaeon]|nr:hypothetical protein [Candidatus Aenigmarchaeota archaeon]